ncbi:hypothetical protein DXO206_023085 (plasmid) [Xanthomonas oryzae pv. oryzae]|uniref:hypothetical protein n=1 Tax=Xanthomonas TaxID=338 RepID=UPI00052C82E6|nr:hypothetical protein EBA18_24885 [Xanthomonas oryzae pv. oryzae]QEJ71040.1 hypothetical protein BXO1_025060 [Xanthomonas oryzae pv. oryzae]RBG59546.1 hypothetical protein BRM42_05535 [Xanthomonas oryzae pv. oryzae]WJS65993.1 hypothetical protein DXO206_023085 [Xanthomonas oryzae pv. oryzae]CEH39094.1 conserved hypothetical protein [Xanthomonas citri pv. citri]
MKHTVGQIKLMLDELDKEFPEIDENERAADRVQTIKLMADVVNDWLARGYSYAQIAEKLRINGFIRISEKALRHAAKQPKRRRKAEPPKPSEKGEARKKASINEGKSGAKTAKPTAPRTRAKAEVQEPPQRSSSFTPCADSDDI